MRSYTAIIMATLFLLPACAQASAPPSVIPPQETVSAAPVESSPTPLPSIALAPTREPLPDPVTLGTADLLHDGTRQSIVLSCRYEPDGWLVFTVLSVVDSDGNVLWEIDYINPAHAGWFTFFLTQSGGQDYLMEYDPDASTGIYDWNLRVFSLNADGTESILDEAQLHMFASQLNPVANPDEITAFVEKANGYFADSRLLITTDWHVMGHSSGTSDWKIPGWLSGNPGLLSGGLYSTEDSPVTYYEYFWNGYDDDLDETVPLSERIDLFIRDVINAG